MRRIVLLSMVIAATAACRKDTRRRGQAVSPDANSAIATVDVEPRPTFPPPSAEATAKVAAAAEIALPLCKKEREDVVPADARTVPTFVAALPIPFDGDLGVPEDDRAATQEAYLRAGTFPFVATDAAVTMWGNESFVVMVVGDGSDPCHADDGTLLTAQGHPALKLISLNHPSMGDGSNVRTAMQFQLGAGFSRVDEFERGKGAKVYVHACFDQEPQLQMRASDKHLPVRYFAIGTISARWCPDAMMVP